jgi:hypothetical protein
MFGVVTQGVATGLVPGEATTRVAVKQLSGGGDEEAEDFEQEIKIMKGLAGASKKAGTTPTLLAFWLSAWLFFCPCNCWSASVYAEPWAVTVVCASNP